MSSYAISHQRAQAFYTTFDRKPELPHQTHYCPGCGHGIVHKLLATAIDSLGVRDRTILVSVMAANNEIGTLQPIEQIGGLCKSRGVFFHTDAVQAAGKLPLDVDDMGIDLLSLTAHKMYGPKGVGALYVRSRNPRVRPEPLLDGGGHERGLRSGTLPVPLVVGFGKACALCQQEMSREAERLAKLRERLRRAICEQLDHVFLNGHPSERLPGNLNLSFAFVEGEALLMSLQDIAVSSGSACTSASVEPSYVLKALGVPDDLARSSIRFGLGRFNTEEEVDFTIQQVVHKVQHLRSLSPEFAMAVSYQPEAQARELPQ